MSSSVQTASAAHLRPGRGERRIMWGCRHWKRKHSEVLSLRPPQMGAAIRCELGFSLTIRCFWRHGKRWRGRGGVSATLGWSEGPAADPVGVLRVRGSHHLELAQGVW